MIGVSMRVTPFLFMRGTSPIISDKLGTLRAQFGLKPHSDARRRSVEHRLAEHQRPPMVDERESTSTSFDDLPARLLQHRALFLEEMAGIRPQLHRFCSRMGGSASRR